MRGGKDHPGQEAGSCGCFCLLHDPFEMFLDGVLAESEAIGDFFVGKAQHQIDDHHLFALCEVVSVLDIHVWTSDFLMQLFDCHKHSAIGGDWFVRNAEAAQ